MIYGYLDGGKFLSVLSLVRMWRSLLAWHLLRRMTQRWWTALCLCVAAPAAWAQADDRVLTFRVQPHDLARYQNYMQGRDPLDIGEIFRVGLTRHTAEMWLFQVASVLGGCRCNIRYQAYQTDTTHSRAVAELVAGRTVSDPVAGFKEDSRYADQVWFSDPILSGDDFLVGIYTHQSRADVLALQDAERLRELIYVVGRGWEMDRKVLSSKGLRFVDADNWSSALRLIEARRADAILQPFSSQPRRALAADGYEANFVPVPGFMVRFGYGRHFTVSKKHPEGEAFLRHLNAGLRMLRDSGFVQRLWLEAGVVHADARQFREVR